MRHLLLASSIAAAVVATTGAPALADKAPWCAFLGGRGGGGTECLYYSYAQCQATSQRLRRLLLRKPELRRAFRRRRSRRDEWVCGITDSLVLTGRPA